MNLRAAATVLLLECALAGCGRIAGATAPSAGRPSSVAACLRQIPALSGLEPGNEAHAHLSKAEAIRVARADDGLFAHGPIDAEYLVPKDASARVNAGSDGPVWAVTVGGLHISPYQGGPPAPGASPSPLKYVSTGLMLVVDRTAQVTVLTFCD